MNLGKTKQINFYNIDNSFYFVDLPGYGFSKMSKQEQSKVGQFIEEYLMKRNNISLIIFLVDIRHDLTNNDLLMYDYILRTNLPFLVLCNKSDKIAPTKVQAYVENIKKQLGISYSPIYAFSSENKAYVDEIWEKIQEHLKI